MLSRSPFASLPPVLRRSAILLVVLCLVAPWLAFETTVRLESDGQTVRLEVDGDSLSHPLAIQRVEGIDILAAPSIYPLGGRDLRIEPHGQAPLELPLPARFRSDTWDLAATGDWWVDLRQAREATVFRHPLSLSGPFTLSARFTGRHAQPTRIVLPGDPGLQLLFRRGLIKQEMAILAADGTQLVREKVHPSMPRQVMHLLEPLVRAGMAACLLVLLFGGMGWWRSRSGTPELFDPAPGNLASRAGARLPALLALPLFVLGFVLSIWVARDVLEAMPHFQDDMCYLLRARWLNAGRLYEALPAFWQHLDVPTTYMDLERRVWASIYPIGWPLLLAVGERFDAAWRVAPVCGLLGLLLLWALGRRIYGPWTALAALTLAVLSPLTTLMSASMLSHSSSALLLTAACYLLVTGVDRSSLPRLFGAGLALGYAFGIRPLTAVAVAVPFGVFLLASVRDRWKARGGLPPLLAMPARGLRPLLAMAAGDLRPLLVMAAGGIVGTLPVLVDNALTVGHPLMFAYQKGTTLAWIIGPSSLAVSDSSLATLLPLAFGWGWGLLEGWSILSLTYAFALVPFLLGRANRHDRLLAGTFLAVALAYLGHGATGAHGYGPRFYYDVCFCLFLLTARGFALLGGMSAARAGMERAAPTRALAIALFLALSASAALPLRDRLEQYRGYNGISLGMVDSIRGAGIEKALILLDQPDDRDWVRVAPLLPGSLEADLVFVARGPDDGTLREAFADRPWYLWSRGQLTPMAREARGR